MVAREIHVMGVFPFLPSGIFGTTSGGGPRDWSYQSGQNLPFHLDKTFHCPTPLHLISREFRKGIKHGI